MSAEADAEVGERLTAAGDPDDVVALALQRADERECDVFFVLDDQNLCHVARA